MKFNTAYILILITFLLSCNVNKSLTMKEDVERPFYSLDLKEDQIDKKSELHITFQNYTNDSIDYLKIDLACGGNLFIIDLATKQKVLRLNMSLECSFDRVGPNFQDTSILNLYKSIEAFSDQNNKLIEEKKYGIVLHNYGIELNNYSLDTIEFTYKPEIFLNIEKPKLNLTDGYQFSKDSVKLKYLIYDEVDFNSYQLVIINHVYKAPLVIKDLLSYSGISLIQKNENLIVTLDKKIVKDYYEGFQNTYDQEISLQLNSSQFNSSQFYKPLIFSIRLSDFNQ